jgi:threonine dehydratase
MVTEREGERLSREVPVVADDTQLEIDVRDRVLEAESRIRPHVRETPLEHSPILGRHCDCEVYLKLENLQITGSFKVRGAANKLLSLTDDERERGVVTASTGNHGAAVAHMLGALGCPGSIYLPHGASGAKVERLRRIGGGLEFFGDDCVEAEIQARSVAERSGQVFISPYNDPEVVGGQGTVGLEIERQLDRVDSVLVPVGGGGLISGVAGALKGSNPDVEVIGCQPENSAVMYESVKTGRILELESLPTLSDGTAGGIEPEAITFGLCRRLVDDFLLVSEEEIGAAVRSVIEHHHLLVEGAAALPVAALLKQPERFQGHRVVLVVSGGVIGLETLREVLGTI